MKYRHHIALISAFLLALPTTTLAAALYGSGTVDVNVGLGNATSSANANVNANLEVGASTTEMNEANATSTGNAGGETRGLENALIHVSANDATNATAVISSIENVHTDADFEAFAQGSMQSDANLRDVEASSTAVVVSYRVPAHLFGFIPASINATATASTDGSVILRYPWYAFLYAKPENKLAAQFAAQVQASGTSTLSGSDKAKLLTELLAAFSATINASATASH